MKSKVVLNALALLFAAGAMAQDCTFFFPQTKGTQLVKKGYDAKGNLQSVMTYTVDEVKNIPSGLEVEADYVFKNSAGTVYDKGDLEAFCRDGEFFIEMKETLSNPSFVSTIQSDLAATEAVINYPSVSNAPSNNGARRHTAPRPHRERCCNRSDLLEEESEGSQKRVYLRPRICDDRTGSDSRRHVRLHESKI